MTAAPSRTLLGAFMRILRWQNPCSAENSRLGCDRLTRYGWRKLEAYAVFPRFRNYSNTLYQSRGPSHEFPVASYQSRLLRLVHLRARRLHHLPPLVDFRHHEFPERLGGHGHGIRA